MSPFASPPGSPASSAVGTHATPEELEAVVEELRRGIAANELVLHYQPKVDLREGRCPRAEALVRWLRPNRGLVFPDAFIPLAERCGLMGDLTAWVVREAVRQCRAWQDSGLYLAIAMNISALSLHDMSVLDNVHDSLTEFSVSPFSIEMEVTESGVMNDPEAGLELLKRFDRLGVHISIDDFGTGFSSLVYLREFPVHTLKIDKSFVMAMANNDRNQAIIASTIALGHALGLRVVAEGVEDEATANALRELGCDDGQGYYWTRPLAADQFAEWLANFHEAPSVKAAGLVASKEAIALAAVRRIFAAAGPAELTGILVDFVIERGGQVISAEEDFLEGAMQLDLTLGRADALLPVADPGTIARNHLEELLPLLLGAAHLVLSQHRQARWPQEHNGTESRP